jgi:hypothetical protein
MGPHPQRLGFALSGAATLLAVVTILGITSGSVAAGGVSMPPPDSCAAPLLQCYIVLSVSSGSHGNNETVTGARFYPGEEFSVYFWNGSATAAAPLVAYGSTGTGSFTASFPVPNEPVGNYTVFVTDLIGDNQSAPFHLTHLRATPDSGAVGNTTSLSGQGFLPGHVIKFHVGGVHALTSGRCVTNKYGSFSGCTVTIPKVPTGTARLTATDGRYVARIDFTVT